MSKVLDIPILEYFNNKNAIIRHSFSTLWTIYILLKERPKVIFIQLSFMLLNIIALYKILTLGRTIIVADCHTKALRRKAKGPLFYIFWPIKKATFKLVNISIVSNVGMEKDIKELHDNYLMIPDKIPEIEQLRNNNSEKYFVYVSSFAVDEPFDEIFEVVKKIPNEIKLYWTGKIPKNISIPENKPSNLIFTDYISFEEYYQLISNASAILALTTEDDCLQSGAYEALAVQTPMVLTDSAALRTYFGNSALYTNHSPDEIAEKLILTLNNKENLIKNSQEVKKLRDDEYNIIVKKLISEINSKLNK
jgi:hypothetical protein